MFDFIQEIDKSLFLFLNGLHSPLWDLIMFQGTKTEVWIPFYIVLLFMIIKNYKWQSIVIVVAFIIMITMSDQLSTYFKDSFERPRPSHEPGLQVHLVNLYKGGMYGLYSAHSSNFFSLAMFCIIILRGFYRWLIIPILVWAFFVSYTRIYLGVHYPGDILAGMIVGLSLGYFFGKITWQTCQNTKDWFSVMK